jgi:beta-lactamase superfamily II metal-dependent hydrolase
MDHCTASDLGLILEHLKPSSIYYPRYSPDPMKTNQMDSKKLIDDYKGPPKPYKTNGSGGTPAQKWKYGQVFFNPELTGNPNDDSLITLWRRGNLSVLSVGDLESADRSDSVSETTILNEVDVLILAHHGSSSDFTTDSLLKALNPKICIALVDRQNQYGHPDPTVYQRVNNNSWYYSTKEGDVIIETNGNSNEKFTVYDYISNGQTRKSIREFSCKRHDEFNRQVIREILR